MSQNLSSAAVVIGALRVKIVEHSDGVLDSRLRGRLFPTQQRHSVVSLNMALCPLIPARQDIVPDVVETRL